MDFVLHINCDNAAFRDEDLDFEIARILQKLADQLVGGTAALYRNRDEAIVLRDINGNNVGEAKWQPS